MTRGCARIFILLCIVVLVAVASALVTLLAQQQGLFPWLQGGYRNTAVVVLDSIQDLSQLTTSRFNFSSVITSEREMPAALALLYGERQVLIAVGHVTAGIDLARMDDDDIAFAGGTLTVRLPPPTLQDCFLDEGASYIAERDTGIFARNAPNLDTEARRFAVEQFRQQALEQGILEEAQAQAQIAVTEFVTLLDLPEVASVEVLTTPPDPNAPLPESCA